MSSAFKCWSAWSRLACGILLASFSLTGCGPVYFHDKARAEQAQEMADAYKASDLSAFFKQERDLLDQIEGESLAAVKARWEAQRDRILLNLLSDNLDCPEDSDGKVVVAFANASGRRNKADCLTDIASDRLKQLIGSAPFALAADNYVSFLNEAADNEAALERYKFFYRYYKGTRTDDDLCDDPGNFDHGEQKDATPGSAKDTAKKAPIEDSLQAQAQFSLILKACEAAKGAYNKLAGILALQPDLSGGESRAIGDTTLALIQIRKELAQLQKARSESFGLLQRIRKQLEEAEKTAAGFGPAQTAAEIAEGAKKAKSATELIDKLLLELDHQRDESIAAVRIGTTLGKVDFVETNLKDLLSELAGYNPGQSWPSTPAARTAIRVISIVSVTRQAQNAFSDAPVIPEMARLRVDIGYNETVTAWADDQIALLRSRVDALERRRAALYLEADKLNQALAALGQFNQHRKTANCATGKIGFGTLIDACKDDRWSIVQAPLARAINVYAMSWTSGRIPATIADREDILLQGKAGILLQQQAANARYRMLASAIDQLKIYADGGIDPSLVAQAIQAFGTLLIPPSIWTQ